MASPPPKRQRRATTDLSDDSVTTEEAQLPLRISGKCSGRISLPLPTQTADNSARSKAATTKAAKGKASIKPAPLRSSPKKSKISNNVKNSPAKSRSLHTFFGKVPEEQRWHRKSITPECETETGDIEDIEDEDFGDIFAGVADGRPTSKDGLDRPKPQMIGSIGDSTSQQPPTSSQRFVKPTIPAKRALRSAPLPVLGVVAVDDRPWSERFGPNNLDELAVHKKKVLDVQKWLADVLSGRDPSRLLVLKGPAGSGKSTVISMLAESLKLNVIPWTNPTASESGVTSSVSAQFSDFLSRGGLYDSLSFGNEESLDRSGLSSGSSVLVVEEYPTHTSTSYTSLDAFRSVVVQYIASSDQPSSIFLEKRSVGPQRPPLVMIITEALLTSSTAVSDSFTAHRLLGAELLNHPFVTVIDFNTVAPTLITKALDLVIKKEARESQRRRVPGPAVLHKLAEMGDLRSAINTLEFLCSRGLDHKDWSGTVASHSKRAGKNSVPLTSMEKSSLELISRRQSTLDMFHAAGKVVYNKREEMRLSDQEVELRPKPPSHLNNLDRPKTSEVDIEVLLDETGTDIQTFISTLHENYVLSCNDDIFTESFEACSDYLSASDMLNPDSRMIARSRQGSRTTVQSSSQPTNSDALRQDEIGFQVATRGLLFSLPHPVTRSAHPGGRKSDSYKMFYPASLRLWKPTEENRHMITMLSTLSSTFASAGGPPSGREGVATWQARAEKGLQRHEPDLDAASCVKPRVYLSPDRSIKQTANTSGVDALSRFRESQLIGSSQPTSRSDGVSALKLNDTIVERLYISDDDIEDDDECIM